MKLSSILLAAGVGLAVTPISGHSCPVFLRGGEILLAHGFRDYPPNLAPAPPPEGLPVGRWSVEFANGVKESCEIDKDGSATEVEPSRKSTGTVEVTGGSALIIFKDDRAERWTRVGKRMVVEHWFPASQYPKGTPVLGIAEVER